MTYDTFDRDSWEQWPAPASMRWYGAIHRA